MPRFIFAILISLTLVRPIFPADDARVQAAMKSMATRLRAAETERDSLQAAKLQTDQEKKALAEKLEGLTKQSAADQAELIKSHTRLDELETQTTQLKETLDKTQAAQNQTAQLAQKTETERVKLAAQAIDLQRKVDDREKKNLELYKLANEILKRYEHFGLGDALAAKEPFTGLARVKLENFVQDYQDKIGDQRARHWLAPTRDCNTSAVENGSPNATKSQSCSP